MRSLIKICLICIIDINKLTKCFTKIYGKKKIFYQNMHNLHDLCDSAKRKISNRSEIYVKLLIVM